MIYVSILLIIILISLTAYNLDYLSYFRKRSKNNEKIEEKDNYYKLDAKIELQKYLALGLIAIAAFFGYSQFTELSGKIVNINNFEKRIIELESNFESLQKKYSDISKAHQDFNTSLNEDFNNLNKKMKSAAKRIPENNLRILAELLIKSRIEYIANIGKWNGRSYTKEEILEEINNSKNILISVGYDDKEAKNILEDIERNMYPFQE